MEKRFFLLMICLCLMAGIQAQASNDTISRPAYLRHQKKFTVAIQPMQAFNKSLRLDFEIRLGDTPDWLQIGPAIYMSSDDYSNSNYSDYYPEEDYGIGFRESYSSMKGVGLDVNYKRFINKDRSFYVAIGVSYTYFNIKYRAPDWYDYIENNLEYHEYRYGYQKQQINRLGINTLIGYQIPARSAFLFDMFAGITYRYSFCDKDKAPFDKHMLSFGRKGLVFMTGVRIGVGWGRKKQH